MLRQILAIAWKDLQVLVRDRGGIVTLFLMPIMFILVMTAAMGGMYDTSPDREPVHVLVVNGDKGDLAGKVIADLKGVDGLVLEDSWDNQALTREKADALIGDGTRRVAVVFPAEFTERVLARATDADAPAALVSFVADPAASVQFLAPIQGTVQGFVMRVTGYAQAPVQIAAAFKAMAAGIADPQRAATVLAVGEAFVAELDGNGGLAGDATAGPVTFEQVAPATFKVRQFPNSAQQNVPGYTLFGVFWIVQMLAISLLQEKQDGTFRRLLVAPLPRAALLIGKWLPYYLLNLVQVVLMFGVGVLVFGMNLGNDLPALAIVTLAVSASATGLGLLVAALGRTPEQIGGLSALLVLLLTALGGSMMPTFAMPEFMQTLSQASPVSWAMSGYQDVIVRGLGLSAVLPETAVLMGFAAVFFGFAVWRFRFE